MGALRHLNPFPVLATAGLLVVTAASASFALPYGETVARGVVAVVLTATLALLAVWAARELP